MTASRGVFNSYLPPIPPFTPLPYYKITSIRRKRSSWLAWTSRVSSSITRVILQQQVAGFIAVGGNGASYLCCIRCMVLDLDNVRCAFLHSVQGSV